MSLHPLAMWIFIKFLNSRLTKISFSFLIIIEVPSIIQNKTVDVKNKVVRPKKYLTLTKITKIVNIDLKT